MPLSPLETVEAPPSLSKRRRTMRSSIFILPNAITSLSLFFGFLSIKLSSEGRFIDGATQSFVFAAYAILAAAVCDGLDGSVARLTRTQSAFGVQLDSLADAISFGVAPAFLAYNFGLQNLGRVGFAASFVFAACAVLRLARFNVQSTLGKASGNFTGIPTPMAAAPIAVYVLAQDEMSSWLTGGASDTAVAMAQFFTSQSVKSYFLLSIVLIIAFGMISTLEYISTKTLRLPRKYPFRVLSVILMSTIFLLIWQFTITLAAFFILYCIHGPIMWLIFKRDRGAEEEELFTSEEEDEENHT